MPPLSIATWNINSVRLRMDLLLRMAAELRPDVICLQETKVPDELFPRQPILEAGYRYQAIHGQKGYNGVAVLSRRPIDTIARPQWCGRSDCRHLVVGVAGIEVHNLYVPSGGDIPDAAVNDKFAHKLQFLDELADWYGAQRPSRPMVLVGDLNVAPLEHDVWSHKQMLKVISHTPVEVEKLTRVQRSLDWVDALRTVVPAEQKLYTWWSYRAKDWAASDRGRRLDHVWSTPDLRHRLRSATVLRDARGWTQASDHVPVMVEYELD
jgi:exodeoxyribonuclease-3